LNIKDKKLKIMVLPLAMMKPLNGNARKLAALEPKEE
jgi:hypothetical protein